VLNLFLLGTKVGVEMWLGKMKGGMKVGKLVVAAVMRAEAG
jgi:hypothetical protein